MKLKITYIILLFILFLVADIIVSTCHRVQDKSIPVFKDTLIARKDQDIIRLKKEKDSLSKKNTFETIKVDSSILTIKKLTNVKVTRADEVEAIQWIKDYNK